MGFINRILYRYNRTGYRAMSMPEPKFTVGEEAMLVSIHRPYQKITILHRQYIAGTCVYTGEFNILWVYLTSIDTDGIGWAETSIQPLPPKSKVLANIMADLKTGVKQHEPAY